VSGIAELEFRRSMDVGEQFNTDFDLDLYDHDVSRTKVEREVQAFLGEKLLQPRSEDLFIGRDGRLDPNYLEMMQRSIDYWSARGDPSAVERFESELTGMRNLATLVIEHGINNQPLPIVVTASDPGTFYVDAEGRKKSATFVGLLDRMEDNGWRYKIFSLPTKFIGLNEHKALLWRIGDIEHTKQILGASLVELTANNLVAFPVLLDRLVHSLDELAVFLGYESWDKVEEIAADQLALDSDVNARKRRVVMVEEFTRRILEIVHQDRVKEEKEALVNAMGDMFALYLGWSVERIRSEIAKTVRVALADKLGLLSRIENFEYYSTQYDLGDIEELYTQVHWMINAFRTNPLAQEARVTGCGGSGINYQQGMGLDGFSLTYQQPIYDGFGIMQEGGYQEGMTTVSTNSEPTGKYKDYYVYKPGLCAHCHESKKYVAYPKSPDTPCAGWCSDCET